MGADHAVMDARRTGVIVGSINLDLFDIAQKVGRIGRAPGAAEDHVRAKYVGRNSR